LPNDSTRRFTLVDAMILIAAAAIGLASARSMPLLRPSSSLPRANLQRALSTVTYGSSIAFPTVMAFTVATLALRSRRPRPRLRKILREPGAVGCTAATFSLLLTLIMLTPTSIFVAGNSPSIGMWLVDVWIQAPRVTGSVVASVWFVQALSGRWRAGREWIDRLGRVVASCWLLALALRAAMIWASLLDL
jgi:hypothetical protein